MIPFQYDRPLESQDLGQHGAEDSAYMRHALTLARRALGQTAPNPPVGCVVVRGGAVVGEGWTQPGGRPHAEAVALMQAGDAARGATVYVTLEPCAHYGKSPPCADALVAAGVKRVVVALPMDPDERVCGRGLEALRRAGIEVVTGVHLAEALDTALGFFSRIVRRRPYLSLKLATSLDGRIGTSSGSSRWITSEAARREVHRQRAEADAVMTGVGTVLADDPLLTHRGVDHQRRQPIRIVLDSALRIGANVRIIQTAREAPAWIVAVKPVPTERAVALERAGARVIACHADEHGRVNLRHLLSFLADEGVNKVMVEAGAGVATSLLRASLLDELVWFRAPTVLGADAIPAFAVLNIDRLDQAPRLARRELRAVGEDVVERLALEDGFREQLAEAQRRIRPTRAGPH